MTRAAVLFLFLLTPSCAGNCPAPSTTGNASNPTMSSTSPETTTSSAEMAKVSTTLDRFHAAAAAADEAAYFAFFAEGGVFLGTDATERWTVPQFRAYAHPRFAAGKAWSFKATHRELVVRGDVAWFDEALDTTRLGRGRGSGVLVREPSGEWKVAQYNLSIPIPNERFEEVQKIIERP